MNKQTLNDLKLVLFLKSQIRDLKKDKQALTLDKEKLKKINKILSIYSESIEYFEKLVEKSILNDFSKKTNE